jgi:ethanolamine phosphate transferase 2 subunit G
MDHINSFLPWFLIFGCTFHTFSVASSSFIEEEHQTWYYLCNTVFIVLMLLEVKKVLNVFERPEIIFTVLSTMNVKSPKIFGKLYNRIASAQTAPSPNQNTVEALKNLHNLVIKWTFFFIVHIILRRLNQTGDKFLNTPDIGDWLVQPDRQIWLSIILFLGKKYIQEDRLSITIMKFLFILFGQD